MSDKGQSPLLETYLAQREPLVRFFTGRLGSAAAAEDLVQEIYIKLLTVDEAVVANRRAYIYRLGWNLMLDRRRGELRSRAREAGWAGDERTVLGGELTVDEPSAEAAIDARQRLDRLIQALEALPAPVQRAFRLHKFDGLSHAEVAQAMGVSRSAVEKYVSAALKHLLKTVARDEG